MNDSDYEIIQRALNEFEIHTVDTYTCEECGKTIDDSSAYLVESKFEVSRKSKPLVKGLFGNTKVREERIQYHVYKHYLCYDCYIKYNKKKRIMYATVIVMCIIVLGIVYALSDLDTVVFSSIGLLPIIWFLTKAIMERILNLKY